MTEPHEPRFVDEQTVRTIRDEFTDIATRIPGGFAGLFYDEEGALTIALTNADRIIEARSALADEPFVSARRALPSGDRFDVSTARVGAADFRYDELDAWYRALVREAGGSMTRGSIGVRRNRILIGVPAPEDEAREDRSPSESEHGSTESSPDHSEVRYRGGPRQLVIGGGGA